MINDARIRAVVVFLPVFILLMGPRVQAASDEKQITVVFMYDDVSSLSPIDIEVRLINALQKYDVQCTFNVIPHVCVGDWCDLSPQDVAPLTPTKINVLKSGIKAGVLEVAQHGYSHQTISRRKDFRYTKYSGLHYPYGYTEFSGLNYDSQTQKIM